MAALSWINDATGGLAASRQRLDNRAQIATLERQVASLVVAIAERLAGTVSLA